MTDQFDQKEDQEFTDCITLLANSFAVSTQTKVQQENFFRLAALPRKHLPQGSSEVIAESFLAVTISIISLKENAAYVRNAIKILHTFLRYDSSVFHMFRPNKPLLMKMRLEEHILSSNAIEVEDALELTYFLLRYHRAVDFGDFSE